MGLAYREKYYLFILFFEDRYSEACGYGVDILILYTFP